jgi:type VI secretion system protein ImpF
MARPGSKQPQRLPLLDRLLQGESGPATIDAERTALALREAVRRDLEILFNTRPRCRSWPSGLTELLLSFGLADLQTRRMATPGQQEEFRVQLEGVIRRFEPRFREVSVNLLANTNPLDRSLRFRIQAILRADVDSEPVVYDTLLDPASRGVAVAVAHGAY